MAAVYRFTGGRSYKRNTKEKRGCKSKVPKGILRIANAERIKLLKAAANDYTVTWSDIHTATKHALKSLGLLTRTRRMPSQDWLSRKLRIKHGVCARPGKRRISLQTDHAKRRYAQALRWVAYPQGWWSQSTQGIHAYIDNKKFVCPRNATDKKRLRATMVTHHLRTKAEGRLDACVLPRRNPMLLGIPSLY